MLFHAKALEVYTHTYDNLEAMNTQKDLEVEPMPMIQLITPKTKKSAIIDDRLTVKIYPLCTTFSSANTTYAHKLVRIK